MAEQTQLQQDIGAAFDEVEAKHAAEVVEPAAAEPVDRTATEQTAAERARDEATGRFTSQPEKRNTLTLNKKVDPNAAKEQERQATGQNPGAKVVTPGTTAANPGGAENVRPVPANPEGKPDAFIQPPVNWGGKGKVEWQRLHHDLRKELTEELAKAGEASSKFAPLNPVIAPYEERFQREFGGTDRAIGTILNAWQFARQDPLNFTVQFAQQYGNGNPIDFLRNVAQRLGVDPQSLGSASVQEAEPMSPLQQRLAAVENQLQQVAQQPVIAQQNQIQTEIQAFATKADPTGNLAHPYFNDVKTTMASLMSNGTARTLDDAYEQATWANPTTRAQRIADQERQAAEQRRTTANGARAAAVSVTGAPGITRPAAPAMQQMSVADSIRQAMEQLNGAGRA